MGITLPDDISALLQQRAAEQNTTPEDLLRRMLTTDPDPCVRELIQRTYTIARAYWQQHGMSDRAALTDTDLDVQFAHIDANGVPLLKADINEEALHDPLLQMAAEVQKNNLRADRDDLSENMKQLLRQSWDTSQRTGENDE